MWDRLVNFCTETIFRLIGRIFPPVAGPLSGDPKLILIFSTTGIGDALFDTAAVRSLRTAYPHAQMIVCAHRKRRTVFSHNPDVDEVLPYGKSPLYGLKLLARFRKERPDIVILLNINPEVVPIAYCINRRALYGGVWRCGGFEYLLSYPISLPEEGHILRLGAAVSTAAGGASEAFTMVYVPKEGEIQSIKARFSEWIHSPFIIFQAGGGKSRAWRDWPVDSYIRNIRWLQRHFDLKVVLTGGWDNEKAAGEISAACPGVINLCASTSLEETAALLTLAIMLVSTDTGVLFMAYATGCPALAILHYASPGALIGPLDPTSVHEVVELPKPVESSNQLHGEMGKIRDEDVRGAIKRILASRKITPLVEEQS